MSNHRNRKVTKKEVGTKGCVIAVRSLTVLGLFFNFGYSFQEGLMLHSKWTAKVGIVNYMVMALESWRMCK